MESIRDTIRLCVGDIRKRPNATSFRVSDLISDVCARAGCKVTPLLRVQVSQTLAQMVKEKSLRSSISGRKFEYDFQESSIEDNMLFAEHLVHEAAVATGEHHVGKGSFADNRAFYNDGGVDDVSRRAEVSVAYQRPGPKYSTHNLPAAEKVEEALADALAHDKNGEVAHRLMVTLNGALLSRWPGLVVATSVRTRTDKTGKRYLSIGVDWSKTSK